MADTFTISSSTFAFIVGGVSLLGLIINVARFHLPSNKIKVLESLLDETETFFKKAVEDGLLIEPSFVRKTEQHLAVLRQRTCSLRSIAYGATTLRKDYAAFFQGTSTAIGRTCQSLKILRAEVISTSEERRRELLEMNSATQPAASVLPPIPQAGTQAGSRPTLLPAAEIARPHSCPPRLSVWTSDDTQSIATRTNSFNDPTQIDSDVQTTDVSDDTSVVDTSDNLELED